ncbi:MAG: NADH-quinone oxidoreductase subunit NuoH [Bacteroidia bacterium]|nr:NADH-quinone oxidoreductase subunit NuoH [Bacteroidia bacterium]MBN8691947.1 NADH-quinone oxidoreductase subunit NuoH [Bacteroidota bacterium]
MMISFIIYKAIICLVVFLLSLGVAAYATLWERKFAAFLQDRVGPDKAGPWGLLQPLADGGKMFFKEEIIPNVSNRFLFILGPSLFMLTALMTGTVIPWAKDVNIGGQTYSLQITDINIGVLYLLGVVSIGVYGIMIGGWASNNKYALLGAIRASSQMISYEIAMGISIIALIITAGGTLSIREIIAQQDAGLANVVYQPLGFLIFFVCALAETNRAPFDLPECESELVGGYHTEYSSMKLGLFLFAEYINMFISSAIMAGFYFGGYNFPFAQELYDAMGLQEGSWIISLIGFGAYFTKIFIFICVFMWVRWTLPRFRYDQLMNLGWKTLLPLSLLNLAITVVVEYLRGNIHI